jgi:hypothetical protein
VIAPLKTPQPIVDRLNKEIVDILHQPDVASRLARTAQSRSAAPHSSSASTSSPKLPMGQAGQANEYPDGIARMERKHVYI